MKTIKKIGVLFLLLSVIVFLAPQKTSAQISVSFQLFYDDLSPHGNWVNYDNYGYVWAPNVSSGFTPYGTNGHWVYTDYGWTWFSNYSWGWAPFHYGRWFYDSYYGWLWAPDTEWGPGWVTWRRSEGYYGWAPIGPGISINIAYSSGYNLPYNQWIFVRDRDFGRTNINNYYINNSNNITIINNSTVINNTIVNNRDRSRYNEGPSRDDVQRQTRTPIRKVALRERNKPGESLSKNELQLYKPRVEKNNNDGRKPIPSKIVSQRDIKPIDQDSREIKGNKRVEPQNDREQRNMQQNKRQEVQEQRNEQQNKKQEVQEQRNEQQNKKQEVQEQRNEQQNKRQEVQEQRNDQQNKQQEVQEQRNEQLNKKQEVQEQRNEQLNKKQEVQERSAKKQTTSPTKQKRQNRTPNNKSVK